MPTRTMVFSENDRAEAVFAVCDGRLKVLTTSRQGRTAILRMSSPGDLLGLSGVLNRGAYMVTAITVEPTLLKKAPREDFMLLLRMSQEMSLRVAEVLARQCSDLILDARRMALSTSVAARLARFLLEWDQARRLNANGHDPVEFTHGEIASMTGTSRETVTRLFSRFEREGAIARRGSGVVIANRERLYRIAG